MASSYELSGDEISLLLAGLYLEATQYGNLEWDKDDIRMAVNLHRKLANRENPNWIADPDEVPA